MSQSYAEPAEPLADEEWLTDAHDAEVGMEVLINTNGGVERYEIDDVARHPDFFLIQFRTTDGAVEKFTAEEINQSPDMVVV